MWLRMLLRHRLSRFESDLSGRNLGQVIVTCKSKKNGQPVPLPSELHPLLCQYCSTCETSSSKHMGMGKEKDTLVATSGVTDHHFNESVDSTFLEATYLTMFPQDPISTSSESRSREDVDYFYFIFNHLT